MIPTPTTLVILTFGVATFIFIMLLPALFEIKRPGDAGPRKIMDNIIGFQQFQLRQIIPLMNVEEEKPRLDKVLVEKIADIIAFLPNLEA